MAWKCCPRYVGWNFFPTRTLTVWHIDHDLSLKAPITVWFWFFKYFGARLCFLNYQWSKLSNMYHHIGSKFQLAPILLNILTRLVCFFEISKSKMIAFLCALKIWAQCGWKMWEIEFSTNLQSGIWAEWISAIFYGNSILEIHIFVQPMDNIFISSPSPH